MSILSKPYFHDETAAYEFLESIVWADGNACPHCGCTGRIGKIKALEQSFDEFGDIEGLVVGVNQDQWGKPAIRFRERLSGKLIECRLDASSAGQLRLNPWSEAWEGKELCLSGQIFFDPLGIPKSAKISSFYEIQRPSVDLKQIRDLDILEGRSVAEHIGIIRSEAS